MTHDKNDGTLYEIQDKQHIQNQFKMTHDKNDGTLYEIQDKQQATYKINSKAIQNIRYKEIIERNKRVHLRHSTSIAAAF
jgi:hypothetical protein